jgi:4-hydroxy-2-oxoheptanedioate aldolase
MKTNTAKQRLLDGKPSVGAIAALGSPTACGMLARAGFDYVLVDNQHGGWGDDTSALAFREIALGGCIPMARVAQNDFCAIGRLLDRGALGIIVPMVDSAEEAAAAAQASRYPPRGGRSWWPLLAEFHGADYGERIDDELFLAVQLESLEAAERAEEILSVDGVDGCWIGPTDLARSMGVDPSTVTGKRRVEEVIQQVLETCVKVGKIPGIASMYDFQQRIDQGFRFVTGGSDVLFLLTKAHEIADQVTDPR